MAQAHYLLGVSAFYANDVDEALSFLTHARDLYEAGGASSLSDNHKYAFAFCYHFLGVIGKNWRKVAQTEFQNLQDVKGYLRKADQILAEMEEKKGRKKHEEQREFLTPLTLVEVISYIEKERGEARRRIDSLLVRLEGIEDKDDNQKALYFRACLLKGNLEFSDGECKKALECYRAAGPQNYYALFSRAHAFSKLGESGKLKELYKDGLRRLRSSGDLEKSEITIRGTILAWATIAAYNVNDRLKAKLYNDFLAAISNIGRVSDREPYFFDPFEKQLVPGKDLKKTVDNVVSSISSASPDRKKSGGKKVKDSARV